MQARNWRLEYFHAESKDIAVLQAYRSVNVSLLEALQPEGRRQWRRMIQRQG